MTEQKKLSLLFVAQLIFIAVAVYISYAVDSLESLNIIYFILGAAIICPVIVINGLPFLKNTNEQFTFLKIAVGFNIVVPLAIIAWILIQTIVYRN